MLKPKDYDKMAASLVFEPLALGGHPCVIKGVEETQSKSGRDMLKVAVDIGEGDPQSGYYQDKFDNDDRDPKRWPCVAYVMLTDKEGACSRQLAGFVRSVEESNPGLNFPWDKPALLKGKKVGGVFGQEEYMGSDGKIHKATKLSWFCSIARAKDAKVPKLKEYRTPASQVNAFSDISADDIPF
jgi:hypothetical protein